MKKLIAGFGFCLAFLLLGEAVLGACAYSNLYLINSNVTTGRFISVNDTYGICNEIFWTPNATAGEDIFVCCEDAGCCSGDIQIWNTTDQKPHLNESSGTGYNPDDVSVDMDTWLTFNDTTGGDASGSGNHWTAVGTPSTANGTFGLGTDLDGVGDAWKIPDVDADDFEGGAEQTITAWVYPTVAPSGSSQEILTKTSVQIMTRSTDGADIKLRCMFATADADATVDGNNILQDRWTFLACAYDGSDMTIFQDGVLTGSDASVGGNMDVSGFDLGVGYTPVSSAGWFGGTIEDLRVYNKGLTQPEILDVMYQGMNNRTNLTVVSTDASPTISIPSPVNDTYWNRTIDFNFTVTDDNDATFHVMAFHDGVTVYDDASYANNTLTTLNITENITDAKVNNVTVWAEDTASQTTTAEVIFTVNSSRIISIESTTFVNETQPTNFTITFRINPDFIGSMSTDLIWNLTTQSYVEDVFNATHAVLRQEYTIPLISINNTEVPFVFNTSFIWFNGTDIFSNSTSVNQNLTYYFWISSIVTDATNYLEGENITTNLYIVNNSAEATISANISIYYNSSYNRSLIVPDFEMTTIIVRDYEQIYNALYAINSSEKVNITGNITITYGGRSRLMSTQATVNVFQISITACGVGEPTFTIRFFNETDFAEKKASLDLILFEISSGEIVKSFSWANTTENETFTYCISPTWSTDVEADIYIEYSAHDSPERQYFVNNAELSTTLSYVDAYLVNGTYGYYTNIFLYDQNSNRLADTYIRVLKMNPNTTSYVTMFIGKTDSEGILPTYVEPLTQPYILVVVDEDGAVLYTTEAENIPCVSGSCPPYEKHIYIVPTVSGYITFEGIVSSLSWDNDTKQLIIQVNDVAGVTQGIRIEIFEMEDFGRRTLYYSGDTSSSSVYYTTTLTDDVEEYLAVVSVLEYEEYYPLITESIVIGKIMALGMMGIIVSLILILALDVAGLYVLGIFGGLIGSGLGLGISVILRLIPLSVSALFGLIAVIVVIGFSFLAE